MTDNFRVHVLGAVKKPRKPAKPKAGPVTVIRANPAAIYTAHALAKGRDVRVEIGRDGAVYVRNGAREER